MERARRALESNGFGRFWRASERANERASERASERARKASKSNDFGRFWTAAGPKMRQQRHMRAKIALWRRFGATLAPLWRLLGASWAQKWRPGAALGLPLRLFCAVFCHFCAAGRHFLANYGSQEPLQEKHAPLNVQFCKCIVNYNTKWRVHVFWPTEIILIIGTPGPPAGVFNI